MNNYLYGNCILTVEDVEVIYPVKPFNYEIKLEKDKAYLKDGYVYIYRKNINQVYFLMKKEIISFIWMMMIKTNIHLII